MICLALQLGQQQQVDHPLHRPLQLLLQQLQQHPHQVHRPISLPQLYQYSFHQISGDNRLSDSFRPGHLLPGQHSGELQDPRHQGVGANISFMRTNQPGYHAYASICICSLCLMQPGSSFTCGTLSVNPLQLPETHGTSTLLQRACNSP